jgi:hypothetical protein
MRTFLLGVAAAFAAGVAVPAPQDPAAGEPPLRFRVAIDGEEHALTENEAKALRVGDREHQVRVVVEPLRRFAAAGLQFDYPRGMNFEHEVGASERWTLKGPDVTLIVVRCRAASAVIAKAMLGAGDAAAPKPAKVVLGGTAHAALTHHTRGSTTPMESTVVAIDRPDGSVVLCVQDVLDDGRRSADCAALLALLAETCVVAPK